jgi:Domain of unknown function (DUF6894)
VVQKVRQWNLSYQTPKSLCCNAKQFTVLCRGIRPKQREIKRFAVARSAANVNLECRGAVPAPDKELVRIAGLRLRGLHRSTLLPMPRYYFNTRIGDELISDPDGEVLRDPDRAWEMARAMIRELLRTEGADGALLRATIEVTDDEGEIVLEFPFAEAILDAPDRSITKH